MRKSIIATAFVAASAMTLTACGSDSEGASSGSDSASGPIKVGVFASLTGPASATFKAVPSAVEARIKAYEAAGGKCADRGFDIVEADDVSTPEGALKASQKLIQSDKVDAVVQASSFFYGASQFLTTQGKDTPVFGGGFDGAPEYNKTDNNLVGVLAPQGDYSGVFAAPGTYYKSRNVTKLAAIAYDSPSASKSLEQTKKSAEAAGLKMGYFNSKVPFGSTDVGPIVQGIISSGADGLHASLNPETSFGVIAGLRQAGYELKSVVLGTGYGADLLKSEPAVKAAQGITFTTSWVPNELGGEAVELQSAALKEYAGNESGVPSFSEAIGWMAADLFLHGLDAADCDTDAAKVIDAVRADKTWNSGGLLATARDFSSAEPTKNCTFYVTLKEKAFVPEEGATPFCGDRIN